MKFAEVIKNSGISPLAFPLSGEIDIQLLDGKERSINKSTITYVEPLFKENPGSMQNFRNFLTGFETEKNKESFKVKIDEISVILFYRTSRALVFMRKAPVDPLSYVD